MQPSKATALKGYFLCLLFTTFFVFTTNAQIPTIASFSPTSGAIGTTVTITGSNFSTTAANNIVYFGATKATVSAATITTLTVTVPKGATYEPISVTTNGLTALSGKPFTLTFTTGTSTITSDIFENRVDSATGVAPNNIVACDLDGDGYADIVTSNNSSNVSGNGSISVLTNKSTSGTISLSTNTNILTGQFTNNVKVVDIDGDGKKDIVITSITNKTVSVLKNTSTIGNITFATKVDFNVDNPYGIAVADFDGDGKIDIAVTNLTQGTISILKNTSTVNTISFASKVDITTGLAPWGISVGDLDNDGKVDIAVANSLSKNISILRNTSTLGTITFALKVDLATTTDSPVNIVIGDIDGDGISDIIIGYNNYNVTTLPTAAFSIYKNTSTSGAISFAAQTIPGGYNNVNLLLSDLNGDGKPEVVMPNRFNNGATAIFQNYSSVNSISMSNGISILGNYPNGNAAADLDNDGLPDLLATNPNGSTISLYRNKQKNPTIVSFTPTSGIGGTNVTINGTYLSNITNVMIGGVPATTFTTYSDTRIVATVANNADYGNVTVSGPNGKASLAGFVFSAPPVITAFTPTSAGTE